MNTREAMSRLEQIADNIRADIGDPQAGAIVQTRNRRAMDTALQRYRADEIAHLVVGHMVDRFGPGMTEHYISAALREVNK